MYSSDLMYLLLTYSFEVTELLYSFATCWCCFCYLKPDAYLIGNLVSILTRKFMYKHYKHDIRIVRSWTGAVKAQMKSINQIPNDQMILS